MDVDVLVIGDLNVDVILRGRDLTPTFGQVEKLIDDVTLTLGSSAGIFASQAARLGLRTTIVGAVGGDLFGDYALKALAERGVDIRACVRMPSLKTGASVILVPSGGSRAILTYSGSIGALHAGHINRALLAAARHLHLASYFLLDGLRPDLPHLLGDTRRAGATISFDTNWDPTERWQVEEILPLCDLLLPNEAELLAIAGESDVQTAVARLSRRDNLIAVKQGARGASAWRAGEGVYCDALAVDVVDTTGAGDSFDAGFVFGYLQGWSLVETLRLACSCGGLSTRGMGGTATQPSLQEALQAGRACGIRRLSTLK
jgi:sugar/nucleoside kinase (ribokinase family)